jgi:hypothetical protein
VAGKAQLLRTSSTLASCPAPLRRPTASPSALAATRPRRDADRRGGGRPTGAPAGRARRRTTPRRLCRRLPPLREHARELRAPPSRARSARTAAEAQQLGGSQPAFGHRRPHPLARES